MMGSKIDVTSTVLEKGIDLAKDFLGKLIMPAVEETGLLVKDRIVQWRVKNQVTVLNKTKEFCERNKISIKTISLKLLCPLLDNAALEDDEKLQDKWAILLSNLVDSEQNIENHVFPYILGQISLKEFAFLEKAVLTKKERVRKSNIELKHFRDNKLNIELDLEHEISSLNERIRNMEASNPYSTEIGDLRKKKRELDSKSFQVTFKESQLLRQISAPQVVLESELREFEVSNLIRLGVIKMTQETYANSRTLEIPNKPDDDYLSVDIDIEVESNIEYILTQLGELFIEACTEKKNQ